MSFAICLNVLNHLHFKKPELIWAEFIPQILFMESIFGYLIVCIVYKWSVDWEAVGRNPPNLLNMLIKLFLSPGSVSDAHFSLMHTDLSSCCFVNAWQVDPSEQLYSGQAAVQVFLLLLALVCVPWMLCTKPYLLYREHKKIVEQGYHGIESTDAHNGGNGALLSSDENDHDDENEQAGQASGGFGGQAPAVAEEMSEEHEFDMGEHVIHQVIRKSPAQSARRLSPL